MLVFGSKGATKSHGTGRFFCPSCHSDQTYVHKEIVRKGHLYFVPLIELGSVAEYVECQTCGSQYDMKVLELPTQESIEARIAVGIRSAIAGMVRADSVPDAEEIRTGRYITERLTGRELEQGALRRDAASWDVTDLDHISEAAVHLTEDGKAKILQACVVVAAADGEIADSEVAMLVRVAEALGVPPVYLKAIVDSVLNPRERS